MYFILAQLPSEKAASGKEAMDGGGGGILEAGREGIKRADERVK